MKDKTIRVCIDRVIESLRSFIEKHDEYSHEVRNINTSNGQPDENSIIGYYRKMTFDIPNSTHKKLEITYTCTDKDTINLDVKSVFESPNSNSINDVYNKDLNSEVDVYNSVINISAVLASSLKSEVAKVSPIDIMIMNNMSYFVGYNYQGITDNIIKTIESVADQFQPNSKDVIIDQINQMDNELMRKIFATEHIVISIGMKNLIFYAPRRTIVNIKFSMKPDEVNNDLLYECKVDALQLNDPLANEDIMTDPISVLLKNASINNR